MSINAENTAMTLDAPVQVELNRQKEASKEYEQIRKTCSTGCLFTAYQFHHWLIDKGYLIVKPAKEK